MFQITIWSIPPLLAALVSVGAYVRVRQMKRVPGMQALLTLLAAVMFWSGAQFAGSVFTVALRTAEPGRDRGRERLRDRAAGAAMRPVPQPLVVE